MLAEFQSNLMRNINVLHVYRTSMPASYGGVESFIDTLCRADSRLGVNNSVLTLNPAPQVDQIKMNGYTVHQARQDIFISSTAFSLAAFAKFKRLSGMADIIHYHFPHPFSDILHFYCKPRKPSIVTYHSDVIRQKYLLYAYRPIMHRFLSSVDRIVATSPNYLASSEILQHYASKVSVIPIGIDPAPYGALDSERLEHWRKRFPEPFFLFVGAIRYYKGLKFALEAAAGTQIKIVIAGVGKEEKALKTQADSLQLSNVEFLGFVDDQDKSTLLNLCYGFIFPSHLRSEAFGISLLEAAMAGKPLVSCEIGTGTTFVNRANETGLVISPGSADELRDAMQFLLDHPDVALRMGERARQRSLELFSVDKQANLYNILYRDLIK